MNAYRVVYSEEYLEHHGILGQKWGVRRFQNSDGTLTAAGRKRYGTGNASYTSDEAFKKTNAKKRIKESGKSIKKDPEINKIYEKYKDTNIDDNLGDLYDDLFKIANKRIESGDISINYRPNFVEDSITAMRIAQAKKASKDLKAKVKAENNEKVREQKKKNAIANGDYKYATKHFADFTDSEMNTVITRYGYKQKLDAIPKSKLESSTKTIQNVLSNISGAVGAVKKIYDNGSALSKALSDLETKSDKKENK